MDTLFLYINIDLHEKYSKSWTLLLLQNANNIFI